MKIEGALSDMIAAYQELNSAEIDELEEQPSPLEFLRYVASNRPFVVRRATRSWKAYAYWNAKYLRSVLGDSQIQVAVTPDGKADAPMLHPETGRLCFAKPLEREMSFSSFMNRFERQRSNSTEEEVWYAQTQNDNLRGEYSRIFADVEKDIRWASIALRQNPDAINMWIGDSKSTTSMHKDPYQNIYCQVIGQKHFVLVSPIETACVNEQLLDSATWIEYEGNLRLTLDATNEQLPHALWSPDESSIRQSTFSKDCKPLRVTLEPGDLMYLPAMWYHQVSQTEGSEGFCCSVNYWYDMEYTGSFFPHDQLVRVLSQLAAKPS